MSNAFVRIGHLHTPSRVLSATSESGRTVAPPLPASTNKGALRLRATGTPTAVTDVVTQLQTGGNPTGYANADSAIAAGAALVWRNSTDTTSQYRGHIDSLYLTRVEFPVAYSAGGYGGASTPRTLANGDLGFTVAGGDFYRISATTGVVTTVSLATGASTSRPDLVVLPSGRLLAFSVTGFTGFASTDVLITVQYSDDHGTTWATLADQAYQTTGNAPDWALAVEYTDDLLTAVLWDTLLVEDAHLVLSRDGGCTFGLVENLGVVVNPRLCVTATGSILYVDQNAINVYSRLISPGGGFGNTPVTIGACQGTGVPVCRDDGMLWCFRFQPDATVEARAGISVSTDGGLTWSDPTDNGGGAQMVMDSEYVSAVSQFVSPSVGCWKGALIVLVQTGSNVGTNAQIQMLTFGGWESVTDVRRSVSVDGQPYEHVWTPVDYPSAMGWATAAVGAGATITNQPWLRIVSTGADNTHYRSPAAFFSNAVGSTLRVRFRTRVNSGGSVADNRSHITFILNDGANEQEAFFRFSTTQTKLYDGAGNVVGTFTVDNTGWVDWLVALRHDGGGAGTGKVSVWHKLDSAALWVNDLTAGLIAEVAGLRNRIEFGGTAAGACSWDWAFIAVADDSNQLYAGFTNPTQLAGRPLGTLTDYYLTNGIHVGGRNGGAVPGDTYTVTSTYQYPKEAVWREMRPSKKMHSSADAVDWYLTFYAGATDTFKGDFVGVFGTNFRTGTMEFSASSSPWATAASVALDATLVTSTVGAGVRGPGYLGPAVSLNWRVGQYKSDGDGHRYFLSLSGTTYEITDNDEARLYVEGVDFSAAAGTFYIFGDKMAATTAFKQYQYMRLLVGAQDTSDGEYHIGTPVFDKLFSPVQTYDHGFVDRIEPRVELTEAEAGYRSSTRFGPRRYTLAIQWPPIAYQGPANNLEHRLRDFYASIEGSHRPIVFWRDTTDVSSVGLYRVNGVYQGTNVWGEGVTALTRVDQLILEEEL